MRFSLALAVLALLTFALTLAVTGGAAPGTTTTAAAPAVAAPQVAAPARQAPQPAARRQTAKATFSHTCGMCHTLRASGMRGLFGPDLDEVQPSAARVRRMIRTGSLDGVMQPGLLRGAEARGVAAYVARVAGTR